MLPEGGLRFAGYLARPRRHSIVGPGGDTLTIGPKAMAVLVCLAKRPRRVVPKDDLLAAAWKDENVTEGSLFNAISELRGALEGAAVGRSYDTETIQTIRGEGYSLNADVEWIGADPEKSAPPRARPRRTLVAVAITIPAVIAVVVGLYNLNGTGSNSDASDGWQTCRDDTRASFEGTKRLYDNRQYDLAIDHLGRVIDADPSCAYPYELRARIYNNRGEKELALRDIENALGLPAALHEITRIFFLRRKAQIEEDVPGEFKYLKKLNSLEPLEAEWHYHLGWFYKTHYKDCDKSHRRFQDAVKYDPQPIYHAQLCDALLVCGEAEEALSHLEAYVALRPGVTAHDYQGWVFTVIGRYERAEKELLEARRLAPDYHHAVLSLGIYWSNRGHYSRAIDELNDYRSRVELANEEAVAYATLGEVYLVQRRFDDAIASANQALAIKSNSHQALWVRGQALLSKGELAAAEEVVRTLDEIGTRSGSLYGMEYLHHLRGRIAWAEGRLDEAVSELRKALDLNPVDRAYFGDTLANALFASGDLEGAEEAYLAVLGFNPSYGRSRCGLGELYEWQGFTEDAVEEYERCLKTFGEDNEEEPLAVRAREKLSVLR